MYSYKYHRDLHSCPTRRSSDLKRNETLIAMIERNVRVPVKVMGDLRAQLAACHISESSLIELARHYGPDKIQRDRKSTRLNSSHLGISYAVFCLKKKKITHHTY